MTLTCPAGFLNLFCKGDLTEDALCGDGTHWTGTACALGDGDGSDGPPIYVCKQDYWFGFFPSGCSLDREILTPDTVRASCGAGTDVDPDTLQCTPTETVAEYPATNPEADFLRGDYPILDGRIANDTVVGVTVSPGCVATLYQHNYYKGWVQRFEEGSYDLYDAAVAGNAVPNDASSMQVTDADEGTCTGKVMLTKTPSPLLKSSDSAETFSIVGTNIGYCRNSGLYEAGATVSDKTPWSSRQHMIDLCAENPDCHYVGMCCGRDSPTAAWGNLYTNCDSPHPTDTVYTIYVKNPPPD
jgi:hypothetical protein